MRWVISWKLQTGAPLIAKINIPAGYSESFDKMKSDYEFLRNVVSSEKYEGTDY